MNAQQITKVIELIDIIQPLIEKNDFPGIVEAVTPASAEQLSSLLKRLPMKAQAIVYRLLPKERALDVFELLSPRMQSDLIHGLQDAEVTAIFTDLDPDDRVWLLDELPAALAPRLLHGLSEKERQLTAEVLGYPKGSVGRRMSPEYVSTRADSTVGEALARVHARLDDAETVYTLPVLDDARHVVGIASLRDLLRAEPQTLVSDIMRHPDVATAYQTAEARGT